MLSATLQEAAIEFGRTLRQASVVATYRAATDALEADPEAKRLLADLRERQVALGRLQQSGLTPSREQIEAFRLCQAAVRSNITIMSQLRAASDVKAYLPTVAAHIGKALGADYASLVAPTTC